MAALFGYVSLGQHRPGIFECMRKQLGHRGATVDAYGKDGAEFEILGDETEGGEIFRSEDVVLGLNGRLFCRALGQLAEDLSRRDGELPTDLRGTFILIIWEPKVKRLRMVRDGAGRRTMYYSRIPNGEIVFSSEPKAIHQLPGFERRVRPAAVAQYLAFSFVPGRGTMLNGIEEIPAGSVVEWNAKSSGFECRRWFHPEQIEVEQARSASDWAEEFLTLHRNAIDRLLPEKRELALFLSGGIDSSVVAAELGRKDDIWLKAFSLHFGNDLPNEIPYAQDVARRYRIPHETVRIRPKDFVRQLSDVVWHLDDPIGDPVTMPNYILASHVASQGFGCVFNGEGGDPCFGGPKNLPMLLRHWYGLPSEFKTTQEEAYLSSFRRAYDDLQQLLTPEFRNQIDPVEDLQGLLKPEFESSMPKGLLAKLMSINMRFKGAHLILPKVERMLGAHGLVSMSPLFDEDMIELSFRLPGEQKLFNGVEKLIMKEAYRGLLPDRVLDRPKVGMRVPVRTWFRKELRRVARRLLHPKRLEAAGIWNPSRVKQLLDGTIEEASPRYGMRLWMLLMFEIWRERVLEGRCLSSFDFLSLIKDR